MGKFTHIARPLGYKRHDIEAWLDTPAHADEAAQGDRSGRQE